MTHRARERIFIIASGLIVLLLVLLALLFKADGPHRTGSSHKRAGQLILRSAQKVTRTISTPVKTQVNVDPEVTDPGLRAKRLKFLRSRPLEQHLPYRDHEIGANILNITSAGKLVVLVTYIHTKKAARRDVDRLLARYDDPGSAYVFRYESVFR